MADNQSPSSKRTETAAAQAAPPPEFTVPTGNTAALLEQVAAIPENRVKQEELRRELDSAAEIKDMRQTSTPLDTFVRTFQSGSQRPSRFRVRIELAQLCRSLGIVGFDAPIEWLRKGLLCRTVSTPAREFETDEVTLYGYTETYPVLTEFTSVTCTFLLPLDVKAYNGVFGLFNAWQHAIQNVNRNGNRTFRFPGLTPTDGGYRLNAGFIVETFDNLNPGKPAPAYDETVGQQISNRVEYYNVYPKTLEAATLDWNAYDEFIELQVEFIYTHWEELPTTSATAVTTAVGLLR